MRSVADNLAHTRLKGFPRDVQEFVAETMQEGILVQIRVQMKDQFILGSVGVFLDSINLGGIPDFPAYTETDAHADVDTAIHDPGVENAGV
jgi:hypothetical protein